MKEKFAESEFLAGVPEKLGGAICLQVAESIKSTFDLHLQLQYNNENKEGEFLWTHTTASMGIGFQVTFYTLILLQQILSNVNF